MNAAQALSLVIDGLMLVTRAAEAYATVARTIQAAQAAGRDLTQDEMDALMRGAQDAKQRLLDQLKV